MANLIEAAAELEYVPKDQLAQMVNNPDAGYPSYLVLSEIQRRTLLEKAYNAERVAMEKPSTTVAEEVVANFTGGPQGLAGGTQDLAGGPQGLAGVPPSSSEITSSGGMPALMAQGGRTGYQNTGKTKYRIIDDDSNIENLDRKNVGANPDMYGDYIAGAEKIRKSGLFDFGELPVMDTRTTDKYLEDLSGFADTASAISDSVDTQFSDIEDVSNIVPVGNDEWGTPIYERRDAWDIDQINKVNES